MVNITSVLYHLGFLLRRKFAVTKENSILLFHAPGRTKEFNPFVLHRTFYGAYDEVVSIDWSSDSRFLSFVECLVAAILKLISDQMYLLLKLRKTCSIFAVSFSFQESCASVPRI